MVKSIRYFYYLNLLSSFLWSQNIPLSSEINTLSIPDSVYKQLVYFDSGCTGIILNKKGLGITTYDCLNRNFKNVLPLGLSAKSQKDELLLENINIYSQYAHRAFEMPFDTVKYMAYYHDVLRQLSKERNHQVKVDRQGYKRVVKSIQRFNRLHLIHTVPTYLLDKLLVKNNLEINLVVFRIPYTNAQFSDIEWSLDIPSKVYSVGYNRFNFRSMQPTIYHALLEKGMDIIRKIIDFLKHSYHKNFELFDDKKFTTLSNDLISNSKKRDVLPLPIIKKLQYYISLNYLANLLNFKNWVYVANKVNEVEQNYISEQEKKDIEKSIQSIRITSSDQKDVLINSLAFIHHNFYSIIYADKKKKRDSLFYQSDFLKDIFKRKEAKIFISNLYKDQVLDLITLLNYDYRHSLTYLIKLADSLHLQTNTTPSNFETNAFLSAQARIKFPTKLNKHFPSYSTLKDIQKYAAYNGMTYNDNLTELFSDLQNTYIHYYTDINTIMTNGDIVLNKHNQMVGMLMPNSNEEQILSLFKHYPYVVRRILSADFIYHYLLLQCPRLADELQN